MNVTVNGEEKTFEAPLNLYDCLAQEGVVEMLVAVARNGTFIPRTQYKQTVLEQGDLIDIVAPMQGG